jgi:hypothetical protein
MANEPSQNNQCTSAIHLQSLREMACKREMGHAKPDIVFPKGQGGASISTCLYLLSSQHISAAWHQQAQRQSTDTKNTVLLYSSGGEVKPSMEVSLSLRQ